MDCYFHPGVEGVVQCGNCGVAMCRECEANAFFHLNADGTGPALCNRCALAREQGFVAEDLSWLRKRAVKLIICTIVVLVGVGLYQGGLDGGVFKLVGMWAVAGIIAGIGQSKAPQSVGNALFSYDHPLMSFIGSIIGYAIAAPVFILFGIVGFLRTLADYKQCLKVQGMIEQAIAANTQGQA